MTRLIIRRLVQAIPLLLVVTSLTFILISFIPGSVATALYGLSATPAQLAVINRKLGFDEPLYTQYWHWVSHAVQGNLGDSLLNGQSVVQMLNGRLAVTLDLVIMTLIVVAVVGVGLGVITALRGGWVARSVDRLSWLGQGVPNFWVALLLVSVFAVSFRLLPTQGYVTFATSPWQWFKSLILPVVSLSIGPMAVVMKQTRTSMVEELSREYVRTLRAAGVSERSIVFRHALKNAAAPVLTVLGLVFVGLLSGTVVVENVFGLPGLGSLAVSSVPNHDLPVIEGIVLYFTIMVIIVNLLLDVLYILLNPKVRVS